MITNQPGRRAKKETFIGVRLGKHQDVQELLRAAKQSGFGKNSPAILVRCARLHLMQLFGENKSVQAAIAAMRRKGRPV